MEPRKTFNMGESIVPPPPFRIIKVQPPPPPPPDTQELHFRKMGIKGQYPPPPPQRHGNFTSGKWWVGENMLACVHGMLFALLSLAAVGKVSKPRRGHPQVESLWFSLTLR